MSSANSSASSPYPDYFCNYQVSNYISNTYAGMKAVVVLPLCAFVLHLGLQRWRRERSLSAVSHSDVFTYHLCAVEMIWGPGFLCQICGTYLNKSQFVTMGGFAFGSSFYGEGFFHILICVDRYLAAVHPILYVGLRGYRGVRIRNLCALCSWLLCLGLSSLFVDPMQGYSIFLVLFFLAVAKVVVTFCSASVLCVLIGPGPRDAVGGGGSGSGGEKRQMNQVKRRAFRTISTFAVVLWVWFLAFLSGISLFMFSGLSIDIACPLLASVTWFNFPTSLVAPLMYLHRAGKVSFRCRKRK